MSKHKNENEKIFQTYMLENMKLDVKAGDVVQTKNKMTYLIVGIHTDEDGVAYNGIELTQNGDVLRLEDIMSVEKITE